jgi:hypothetical protein
MAKFGWVANRGIFPLGRDINWEAVEEDGDIGPRLSDDENITFIERPSAIGLSSDDKRSFSFTSTRLQGVITLLFQGGLFVCRAVAEEGDGAAGAKGGAGALDNLARFAAA